MTDAELNKAVEAGLRYCDLYDVASNDIISRQHLRRFLAGAFESVAIRADQSLAGCLHPGTEPNSCQYEGQCLSASCNHNGKTTFRPRMTLEAQVDGILYPKVES